MTSWASSSWAGYGSGKDALFSLSGRGKLSNKTKYHQVNGSRTPHKTKEKMGFLIVSRL